MNLLRFLIFLTVVFIYPLSQCFTFLFRPQQRGRSAVIEGVYNNVHFMHAVASQIGNVVQIQTKSGAIFEGVFYTVSPHFEIVLQLVHRIEVPGYPVNNSLVTQTSNAAPNTLTSSGNIGEFIKQILSYIRPY